MKSSVIAPIEWCYMNLSQKTPSIVISDDESTKIFLGTEEVIRVFSDYVKDQDVYFSFVDIGYPDDDLYDPYSSNTFLDIKYYVNGKAYRGRTQNFIMMRIYDIWIFSDIDRAKKVIIKTESGDITDLASLVKHEEDLLMDK